MKRLTINQVARANIRINQKAYTGLFLGILTAVFLAAATSLCAWGTLRGHEEQMAQRVGWMDMFTLGNDSITDEQIRQSGFFREIGHVTVTAAVEDRPVCAGYYDGTAERLMNRTLKEGRMPEKAGEIAAEQSALIRLDLNGAKTGDTLTLSMRPAGGACEEKTFVLTGILNEQTKYLETYENDDGMRLPALLVSPEEDFGTGGTETHRVMTYAPLITLNQVQRNCPLRFSRAYGVSRETGEVVYYDSGWARAANALNRILIWAVLGAALMLSACVGITSAMESLLTRKTEDVGMLRAIGATRRQIRRIFGAEAWLMTVTALPAGLLLGVLTAWLISRIAPDYMVFSVNPWLLIPILGLSALSVFIASFTPLLHASRQMPMGVLRDAAMLSKAGKIRNRRSFRPDRLIAGRRTRLYPLRQLGAAGMIALTLFSALMLGELAMGVRTGDQENGAAFRLTGSMAETETEPFSQTIQDPVLSREELNRLKDIEGVSRIRTDTALKMNLLMDTVPEYFRPHSETNEWEDGSVSFISFGVLDMSWGPDGGNWLFWNEEEAENARVRKSGDWEAEMNAEHAEQENAIRAQLGITERVIPVELHVMDLNEADLKDNIEEGSIDIGRLDSGEQVLVYAPFLCVKKEDGIRYSEVDHHSREIREGDWDLIIRNDTFTAGMTLDLLELVGGGTYPDWRDGRFDWNGYFRDMETVRAAPAVGAVLSGQVRTGDTHLYGFAVITTPKGAEALGLKMPGPYTADIWLSGIPDPEKEAEIEEQLSRTAMRGWMGLENLLKPAREYQTKKLRQILLFAALILLFFAVSVLMQVSAATRQIRSETRTIGTLRAVGADLETLVGCYRLPVWVCAAAGMVPCLLFYAVTEIPGLRLFSRNHPAVMIPALAIMAGCVAAACIEGIRRRLATVTRQSIVDNIREL